jgi:hypothetical protein
MNKSRWACYNPRFLLFSVLCAAAVIGVALIMRGYPRGSAIRIALAVVEGLLTAVVIVGSMLILRRLDEMHAAHPVRSAGAGIHRDRCAGHRLRLPGQRRSSNIDWGTVICPRWSASGHSVWSSPAGAIDEESLSCESILERTMRRRESQWGVAGFLFLLVISLNAWPLIAFAEPHTPEGTWQGLMQGMLRLIVHIERGQDGRLVADAGQPGSGRERTQDRQPRRHHRLTALHHEPAHGQLRRPFSTRRVTALPANGARAASISRSI